MTTWDIPYSGYFSRGNIFVVFVVERRTTKYLHTKKRKPRRIPRASLVPRPSWGGGEGFPPLLEGLGTRGRVPSPPRRPGNEANRVRAPKTTKFFPQNRQNYDFHENITPRKIPAIRYISFPIPPAE